MNKLSHEKHQAKYIGQDMMEFLANVKFEDLPPEVVTRAKHIVMDAVAVILAGRDTRKMYDITLDHMAPAGDVAPVGCDFKTTPAMAGFTNALNAQTHDYNDGLNNSGMLGGAYHPGRTVVSTALAVGQQVHASGKDVLLAVVLGIEAAARMRNPAQSNMVADCYSSAVAAAKLLGANAAQFRAACALAADLCLSLSSKANHIYAKKDGKDSATFMNAYKYAFLNRSSIEAAELAMLGYEGGTLNDNQAIASRYYTTGLGKEYQCMDMYFKPWPCCRKTHGAIAAALALKNECGVKAEDVEKIRIYQQSTGMYVNVPISRDIDICYRGQFSLQYTVSCVFLDGTVDLRHYRWPDRLAPQEYVDFSKKIKVISDNGLDGHNAISPNHGIVEVDLKNGETLSMYCQYPLGSEPNQMTEEQRIEKLRYCAGDRSEAEKDRLVNWILKLDEAASL